jgi:hypothetical protein
MPWVIHVYTDSHLDDTVEREREREREDMVILGQWQRAVHAFPTEYPLTVGEDSRGGKCCLPLPMADKGEEPRPEKN